MCGCQANYDDGIDGFEDGYIAGFVDAMYDNDEDDDLPAILESRGYRLLERPRVGALNLGGYTIDDAVIMLVSAKLAETFVTDELLNAQFQKIEFFHKKDAAGAVEKDAAGVAKPNLIYRGGAKILASIVGVAMTDNPIIEGVALAIGASGAKDLYEHAKNEKWITINGIGNVGREVPPMVQAGYPPTYDDFGMGAYATSEELAKGQEAADRSISALAV